MATHSSILGSGLENLLDRGSWRATVHAVAVAEHDLATKQNIINLHKKWQPCVWLIVSMWK